MEKKNISLLEKILNFLGLGKIKKGDDLIDQAILTFEDTINTLHEGIQKINDEILEDDEIVSESKKKIKERDELAAKRIEELKAEREAKKKLEEEEHKKLEEEKEKIKQAKAAKLQKAEKIKKNISKLIEE